MTDLEITKRCAEAMGIEYFSGSEIVSLIYPSGYTDIYDPLCDDMQAMQLVRKLHLHLGPQITADKAFWRVWSNTAIDAGSTDLNRAICECVAKMQLAKQSV